jgi:hypothetical protein
MIRVGIDGPDTSHVRLFTEAFAESGSRIVSLLDNSIRRGEVLREFTQQEGLALHDDWHSFADTVNAVLLLGIDWTTHVDRALPYLEQGKRVFVDKPVAGSFADLIRFRELLQRYPSQIFGGSALPHHAAFIEFMERFRFFARTDAAEVEIFGAMDSYFMASHSYELASAMLGDVKDAVVQWSDQIRIHSAIGPHETTISLKQSPSGAEHPWTIRARIGKQLLLCSFPLVGIYDGLLKRLSEHLTDGAQWSPGISIELGLAAERSGHRGHPVSVQELDLGDMIPSDAFVAEYRSRYSDQPL